MLIEENIAIVESVGNGDKGAATTGAGDAFTGCDNKQCAVVSASDHTVAVIKELICLPFERDIQMGAGVLIKINPVALANRK